MINILEYYLAVGSNQRYLWKSKKFQKDFPIENVNIMRTSLDFYESKNGDFKQDVESVYKRANKLMLDSGGYNLLKKENMSEYPWSVITYHRFLERVQPTIAVSMDYNTSVIYERDGIDKYNDVKYEMFEKTIENFIEQWEMKRNYQLMLAVQGVPIEDKIEFLELVEEKIDLKDIEWFGYGGRVEPEICGLLIRFIKNKSENYKFHMLGATYSDVKELLSKGIEFHSFDTITWIRGAQKGGTTIDDNGNKVLIKHTNQTTTEVQRRWMKHHYEKVMRLIERQESLNKKEKAMF